MPSQVRESRAKWLPLSACAALNRRCPSPRLRSETILYRNRRSIWRSTKSALSRYQVQSHSSLLRCCRCHVQHLTRPNAEKQLPQAAELQETYAEARAEAAGKAFKLLAAMTGRAERAEKEKQPAEASAAALIEQAQQLLNFCDQRVLNLRKFLARQRKRSSTRRHGSKVCEPSACATDAVAFRATAQARATDLNTFHVQPTFARLRKTACRRNKGISRGERSPRGKGGPGIV